ISNLVVGKTYQVSFRANCRSGFGPFTSTWSLNGGSFAPFTASPSVGGTNAYYTNSATFTATASTAALVLQNFSSGDTTVLLDAFSILSIPYGSFSATNILAAATTDLAVSNFVTGLLPGAKYYFHVVANNSAGTVTGADLTFTTSLAVPIITTLPASAITTNSAAFSGTVNPSGSATTAYFRYGTDTNYGSFSTTNILAAENNFLTIFNLVSNLSPATLYHFQLVASNIAGSTAGADQTFTTVRLPMVMNITNAGDSGPGTLRQAILDSIPDDTIFFDAGLSNSPILLTSGQLLLTNNLTISAAALPGGLQINGNGGGRLFQVDSSATVVLTALTLTNGGGVTSGGGIYNSGILTLNRCTLAGNSVIGVAGGVGGTSATGGTGGTSFGGALYNAGTLTLNQCTLAGNLAKGGTGGRGGTGFNAAGFSSNNGGRGGDGGTGGTGTGGAIYNAGILAVNQCTLSANTSSGGNGGSGGPGGNHGGFGGSNGSPGNTGGVGSATAGGIYQSSTLTLFNSIVAGNTPDNIVGSFTSTGNNLTSGNPLLSGLGNNGGPTPTMVLLAGSPAFDAGASTTFTTDQRGLVRVMGAAPDIGAVEMTVPNVSTLAAANVTSTTATLNGTINPNSVAATVFFQYGTTTNYGSYSSTNALPTTNVNLAVVNSIANLQPATTYHFRIVASSSIGLVIGSDLTFTTGAAAPTATTLAATGITSASATLNSTVNPNGLTTAAYFEFGLTTGYGLSTATNSLIATNTALGSANLISSLSPGTLYHFRIVAINSSGSALGSDLTFTTAPLVPVVTTLAATAVSPSNATLNATVNPGSGSTTAYFKYGPTTGYGSFSATNNLTATSSTLAVSTLISNLPPGSLFHFQVVAVNSAGSASGSDQTFTTLGAAPTVTTVAATGIGATNATLRSTINPNGLATAAYFQYGTDTNYGTFSATNNLAATNTSFAVSNLVSNLLPGTLYHFRSVAINSAGSALGQDLTFTTSLAAPKVTTLAATGINATSVTLNGMVNPGNAPTMAYFQYSLETNYPGGTIANPSFETNHYTVSPGYASGNGTIITGWTISKTTRIGLNPANGSPFADNGATPDGANVAFIQSNADTNTLSTTISNLIVDKSYLVSFRANCRTGLAATNSTWSLNGGSFVPFTSSPAVGGTNTYYTNSAVFIATNSTAALALRNSTPVDTTVLLDAFSMVSTAANFSPSINVAATNADVAVSYVITGLQPATTYYFQIAASNSVGRATGAELSFTTGATDPTVTTLAATGVSATSATLNATVNPNGSVIAAYFEYGTTTNYGLSSATNNLAITNITLAVSNLVSSLSPATLYHFRIVANNDSGGSMPGSDQTLTTSMAAPTIIPLVATLLNTNAATGLRSIQLSALVDPNGSTTTSYIEYGLTTAYAATNPFPSLSASIVETNLTAIVSFSAGFTYHWRIVAANSLGTTTSPDQTFILGTLSPPGGGLAGDLNGDGFVSQAELDAVYGNYVTNSPWLYMTNVSGLGGTNVSFALDNPASGAYTVQYSTNLVDWLPLGPATPRYLFTDTNAPALPQRYYRLSYP
ncbi:MAG: hypothetical protein JWQ71_4230, partial [Pedosphaera sp.]|nr:hypothetical protein [Pedosphaera sp.]